MVGEIYNSAKTFWGLALGGKCPIKATIDPVDKTFRITKAVLNEPLRLQTRNEYASLYIENNAIEVELLRFTQKDGIEKPIGGVTFKRGDKVTFRVEGTPLPSVHLIGYYLDEGAFPPAHQETTTTSAPSTHEGKLRKLLADWNDRLIVQLVEREIHRETHDANDDERYTKMMEMITNVETNIQTKVNVDYEKVSVLMSEIRGEINLLREGLGSIIQIGQNDVKKLAKELSSIGLGGRLDAMQQEMQNTQTKYDVTMRKLKEDLENELERVKKDLKKTIATAIDLEDEFDELKELVRSME